MRSWPLATSHLSFSRAGDVTLQQEELRLARGDNFQAIRVAKQGSTPQGADGSEHLR